MASESGITGHLPYGVFMRFAFLILICLPTVVLAQVLSQPDASELIGRESVLNNKCRDGAGGESKTMKACEQREALVQQLIQGGWCYGDANQAMYLRYWKACGIARAAQLTELESASGVKYSGGLSDALENNQDKGLDWFKNKAFELDRAFVITMCIRGVCYLRAENGSLVVAMYQEAGDYNGRLLQGQFVRVVGTDATGTIAIARLATDQKFTQKPLSLSAKDSSSEEVAGSFDDLIKDRAAEEWVRPASARKDMKVVLQIAMAPDGTIGSVEVGKTSGDIPFDRSAVAAVKSIHRLTEMQGLKPSDFAPYRLFEMTFTMDDFRE